MRNTVSAGARRGLARAGRAATSLSSRRAGERLPLVGRAFSTFTPGTGGSGGIHNPAQQQRSLSLAPQPNIIGDHVDTAELLARMNEELEPISHDPLQVLRWGMQEFEGRVAMSTSFGIQSAVLLHLATQVYPNIPVVWVDTGYLPAETYRYAEELTDTLGLNLLIASNPRWTPARMEAIHGKLWESDDAEAHGLYGRMRKVEPLHNELASLEPNPLVLLSGLRASQTKARANMPPIGFSQGRFKLLPMLRMTDEQVADYMDRNDLPPHPLQAKGYVTVGDAHSSRPVEEGEDPRNTRFGGKFQECGLHVDSHDEPVESPSNPQTTEALLPESLEKTGVKALGLTRSNRETGIAVIMVKKLTEDGTFCRKCLDVAGKVEQDNLTEWIGATAVADVLDSESEGAKLAKHFGVVTAPFFLIRDKETEEKHGEWKVVRSYLQLRKMLQAAAERKLQAAEHEGKNVLEKDPVYLLSQKELEILKLQLDKLQIELREKAAAIESVNDQLKNRAEELGQ